MAHKKRLRCMSDEEEGSDEWDALWGALRQVQRETSCSTKTLLRTLRAITPFLKVDVVPNARRTEKNMFARSGATCLKLNGCIHCNSFVFLPSDKRRRCPECGGDRFNEHGVPNEVFVFLRYKFLVFFLWGC